MLLERGEYNCFLPIIEGEFVFAHVSLHVGPVPCSDNVLDANFEGYEILIFDPILTNCSFDVVVSDFIFREQDWHSVRFQ